MMTTMQNKVIRASAGTGKTYRLSLEYIGLLLRHARQGIQYSEILVITFTKKATSEIRERIYEHLHHIVRQDATGAELENNIASLLGIQITDDERAYLERVYRDMLLNKSRVNINTIDAFINDIFKTIIAPFLGIVNYEIDNRIQDQVLAELYQSLISMPGADDQQAVHDFFFRSGKKTINDYQEFLKSLLYNRWIFDFIDAGEPDNAIGQAEQPDHDALYQAFAESMRALLSKFQNIVQEFWPDKSITDVLKNEVWKALVQPGDIDNPDLTAALMKSLTPEKLLDQFMVLLKQDAFWDGSRVLRGKSHTERADALRQEYEVCKQQLAEYIFSSQVLAEQGEIRTIARQVYSKYDEIKFRDKRFTHSDIAYYTFKYLYDPDLSLIDDFAVINTFYEYLTSRLRFVLIDEFQDTSMVQYKVLLPIINEVTSGLGVKDYGGVIVVGDEKQSIYGWRGGERDLLLAMPRVLNDCQSSSLDTSFRSNRGLINFINNIFSNPVLSTPLGDEPWPYTPVNVHQDKDDAHIKVVARNYSNTKDDDNDISSVDDAIREFVTGTLAPLVNPDTGILEVRKTAVLARKNSDLGQIAAVLDELGIDYILESSGSVLQHRTIVPLMYLLKYIAWDDPYDLLCFLRSDLVLLPTSELKEILLYLKEQGNPGNELFTDLKHIPAIGKLNALLEHAKVLLHCTRPNLLLFTRHLLENYNVPGVFDRENDIVNFNRFLEIMSEYSLTRHGGDLSLKGFLEYCQDNETDERFQQIGLKEYNAITLLTIHKAKGLEYDNVFLFWDLGAYSRGNSGKINYYLEYERDYSRLRDAVYTLNYHQVIPYTRYHQLVHLYDQRVKIEALNTIYVALTRAKSNLYLYFAYRKKGGLSQYASDISEKSVEDMKPDEALLLSALKSVQGFTPVLEEANRNSWEFGNPVPFEKTQQTSAIDDYSFLDQYVRFEKKKSASVNDLQVKRNKHLDLKSVYVINRDIDKGNIVHYYLSYIKYALDQEYEIARKQTLGYFGNLFPVKELDVIMLRAQAFVDKNADLFDRQQWGLVYTEHTLFNRYGRELRLDRLMVNTREKKVMIVDYKTGDQYESEQLDEYVEAISDLDFVKSEQYTVVGKYVKL